MPSRRRLVAIGIVTLLIGILALFPARVAYQWFAPPGVQVSGLQGTIWSGSAVGGAVNGVYFRDLRWQFKPLRLMQGHLAYTIDLLPDGGFLAGDVGVGLGGDIHLNDLRGSIPLKLLAGPTGLRGLGGTANADITRLHLSDGLPVEAVGNLDVIGLLLPLVAPAPLGTFRAEFLEDASGDIVGSVQDTGAVIELVGRIVLKENRAYEFLGRIAANADTPPQIRQQLQFLGTPNDRGQYELRLEGQL